MTTSEQGGRGAEWPDSVYDAAERALAPYVLKIPPECDAHGRTDVIHATDGSEICEICHGDGFSGELSSVALDTIAIEVINAIRKALAAAGGAQDPDLRRRIHAILMYVHTNGPMTPSEATDRILALMPQPRIAPTANPTNENNAACQHEYPKYACATGRHCLKCGRNEVEPVAATELLAALNIEVDHWRKWWLDSMKQLGFDRAKLDKDHPRFEAKEAANGGAEGATEDYNTHNANWRAWADRRDVAAGLRWIVSPITCNSESVKAIAAHALSAIDELERRLADHKNYVSRIYREGTLPVLREDMEREKQARERAEAECARLRKAMTDVLAWAQTAGDTSEEAATGYAEDAPMAANLRSRMRAYRECEKKLGEALAGGGQDELITRGSAALEAIMDMADALGLPTGEDTPQQVLDAVRRLAGGGAFRG